MPDEPDLTTEEKWDLVLDWLETTEAPAVRDILNDLCSDHVRAGGYVRAALAALADARRDGVSVEVREQHLDDVEAALGKAYALASTPTPETGAPPGGTRTVLARVPAAFAAEASVGVALDVRPIVHEAAKVEAVRVERDVIARLVGVPEDTPPGPRALAHVARAGDLMHEASTFVHGELRIPRPLPVDEDLAFLEAAERAHDSRIRRRPYKKCLRCTRQKWEHKRGYPGVCSEFEAMP